MAEVVVDRRRRSFGQGKATRRQSSASAAGEKDDGSAEGGYGDMTGRRGIRKGHREKAMVVTSVD
jgi:hypothetical protein